MPEGLHTSVSLQSGEGREKDAPELDAVLNKIAAFLFSKDTFEHADDDGKEFMRGQAAVKLAGLGQIALESAPNDYYRLCQVALGPKGPMVMNVLTDFSTPSAPVRMVPYSESTVRD